MQTLECEKAILRVMPFFLLGTGDLWETIPCIKETSPSRGREWRDREPGISSTSERQSWIQVCVALNMKMPPPPPPTAALPMGGSGLNARGRQEQGIGEGEIFLCDTTAGKKGRSWAASRKQNRKSSLGSCKEYK